MPMHFRGSQAAQAVHDPLDAEGGEPLAGRFPLDCYLLEFRVVGDNAGESNRHVREFREG